MNELKRFKLNKKHLIQKKNKFFLIPSNYLFIELAKCTHIRYELNRR